MKALVCEMCGSQELVKQDGMYVCQHCGTKYDPEEAKKLMVEVSGTVQIDRTKEIENLYKAARNARSTSDYSNALKHYEKISAMEPDSWEAMFYSVVLKTESIKNGEISSAAVNVSNCLHKIFELVKNNCKAIQDKKKAIKEITNQCYNTSSWLYNASQNYYKSVTKGNGVMALTGVVGALSSFGSMSNALSEHSARCVDIANILINCGNEIEEYFDMNDNDYKQCALLSWKKALDLNSDYHKEHGSDFINPDDLKKFSTIVHKYDSSYEIIEKKGCYVATCVYGSYDCPEVWTLRRYRDFSLAKTWHGRAFIRTYYAISPTLVKWFGNKAWFRNMWKPKLDRMVNDLRSKGVEDTPYEDKKW